MKTKYVVGFMFDATMTSVALIQKQKPAWQAGLLNGIGGKIEAGETPLEAMEREFDEEAGMRGQPDNWKHFCSMAGTNNDGSQFEVDFFFAKGDVESLTSMEAEKIGVYSCGAICAGDWKTVGNVPWIVALAIDFGRGVHPPSSVSVLYFATPNPNPTP